MSAASASFQVPQQDRRYLIGALFGSAVLLSVNLLLPLSSDNETFQSMAMDLIRFHRLPYIGSWAHDLPGTVYVHWLSIVLFGGSAFGFRVFDLLLHLAMSWMLYRILLRWLLPRTACFAILLWNLRYISFDFSLAGQRDEFAIFFLLLGIIFLFKTSNGPEERIGNLLPAFVGGIALAMMPTMRITYGPFILVGVAYLWSSQQTRIRFVASYAAGGTCVLVALIVPYLFVPGGLEQAYEISILYNVTIYGRIHNPFADLWRQLRVQKLYLIPALFGILGLTIPALRQHPKIRETISPTHSMKYSERVLLLGIVLCSVMSIAVMGKYLPYHFEPLMLVVVPAAAFVIDGCIMALPRRSFRVLVAVVFSGFLLLRVFPLYILRPFVANIQNGVPHPIAAAQDTITEVEPGLVPGVDATVASYIDRTAPPKERFEAATLSAGIRWRTERMSATRFTTFWPLYIRTPSGDHPWFQQLWQREYTDSLRSVKPYYIVVGNGPMAVVDWVKITPIQSIHELPGFDSLVLPNYTLDTVIGGYWIYRRK